MSIVFDGVVRPEALTAFVRQVPTPSQHVLSQFLPDRLIQDTKVRADELTRTNRAAKFRAWDARIPMAKRDTMVSREADMPPLSLRNMLGEQERLQLERLRQGGTAEAPQVEAIYNDGESLTRAVRNRMEIARGDVLTDGKLTITNENGLTLEADWGVPAEHFVSSGVAWSDVADADILDDIESWMDIYVNTNGASAGGMIVSRKTLGLMRRNAEIRAAYASIVGSPGSVSQQNVADTLSARGLPPILAVYDTRIEVDGVSTRVTSEDKVIFVPENPSDLGFTAWGITATALELVNSAQADFSFSDAPGITGVQIKTGPPFRQETFVDACGMPVLEQPRLLMVADITVTEESSS